MLDSLEANPTVFYAVYFAILFYCLVSFYRRGIRAEARFKGKSHQIVKFRERGASGHSNKSIITKFAGASRVLDVSVTEAELWIRGIWPAFTYIGTMYDLTHCVPLSHIKKASIIGKDVVVTFTNEAGTESNINIRLKDPNAFLTAIDA